MFERINVFYFLLSFSIGLLYVYLVQPTPKVVLKFPTPYNAGKVTYKDLTNTCYTYKAERAACPVDKSKVKQQPIVEDFRRRNSEKK